MYIYISSVFLFVRLRHDASSLGFRDIIVTILRNHVTHVTHKDEIMGQSVKLSICPIISPISLLMKRSSDSRGGCSGQKVYFQPIKGAKTHIVAMRHELYIYVEISLDTTLLTLTPLCAHRFPFSISRAFFWHLIFINTATFFRQVIFLF